MKNLFLFICTILFFNCSFGQKNNKSNYSELIVGQWVNKTKSIGETKYTNPVFVDTISFLKNRKYIWKQYREKETGNWKISPENDTIVLFNRNNEESKELSTGKMTIPIISLSKHKLVVAVLIFGEDDILYESEDVYERIK